MGEARLSTGSFTHERQGTRHRFHGTQQMGAVPRAERGGGELSRERARLEAECFVSQAAAPPSHAASPRSHAALARQAARAAAHMTMMKPAKASSDDDIAMVAAHRRALHTPGTTAQHLRAGLCRRAGVQSCWPPAEETGARAGCQNVKSPSQKKKMERQKLNPPLVCFASGPTGANSEQGSGASSHVGLRHHARLGGQGRGEEVGGGGVLDGPPLRPQAVRHIQHTGRQSQTHARAHAHTTPAGKRGGGGLEEGAMRPGLGACDVGARCTRTRRCTLAPRGIGAHHT